MRALQHATFPSRLPTFVPKDERRGGY
jgi:hypothetical protein